MTEPHDPSQNRTSEPSASPQQTPDPALTLAKISAVLSPYFICFVGLYLYNRNSLLGLAITLLGLTRLLQLAGSDFQQWSAALRRFFGLHRE